MKRTFTIRQWLWLCGPLGFLFAIAQRPLRDPDFLNGLLVPIYPALWLCYQEHHVRAMNPDSPTEFFGVLTMSLALLALAITCIAAGCCYFDRASE